MNTDTETIARHVTLEDVRAVIESDPSAAKSCVRIREALGRGSFATIQRHLETLRAAAAKPEPVPNEIPPVPEDVKRSLKAFWDHAVLTTTVDLQAQMLRCIAERDSAQKAATVAGADWERMAGDLDAAQAAAQQAQAALESAQQMLKEQTVAHTEALTRLNREMQEQAAAHAAALERERRASELSAAKADAAHQALRGELDRRLQMIVDLKAALLSRA